MKTNTKAQSNAQYSITMIVLCIIKIRIKFIIIFFYKSTIGRFARGDNEKSMTVLVITDALNKLFHPPVKDSLTFL